MAKMSQMTHLGICGLDLGKNLPTYTYSKVVEDNQTIIWWSIPSMYFDTEVVKVIHTLTGGQGGAHMALIPETFFSEQILLWNLSHW